MTKVEIVIDEDDLRKLVLGYLSVRVQMDLEEKDIVIETKSKQNYRCEWEKAAFRATVSKFLRVDEPDEHAVSTVSSFSCCKK